MADNPPTPDDKGSKLASADVVTAWTEAVTDFYSCHSQLVALIDQSTGGQQTVGQCLVSHLWEMIARMEAGLERLWNDIIQIDEKLVDYERIKKHTVQLNQLVYEAQLILHLASLPDS